MKNTTFHPNTDANGEDYTLIELPVDCGRFKYVIVNGMRFNLDTAESLRQSSDPFVPGDRQPQPWPKVRT